MNRSIGNSSGKLRAILFAAMFFAGLLVAGPASAAWQATLSGDGQDLGGVFESDVVIGVGTPEALPAPPAPPSYTIDMRLNAADWSDTYTKEIKAEGETTYMWIIAINPHGNQGAPTAATSTISWNPAEFGVGDIEMRDGFDGSGSVVVADMNTTTSYNVLGTNQPYYFTVHFTPLPDADNDGVGDASDDCPDTPAEATVDANGCADSQKDTDNDGVYDDVDQCADTPAGETANANGCSESQVDTDGDGVYDNADQCPGYDDTLDADSDSVPDGCDVCDGDDASGDSDGDGICNDTDPCPQDDPDDSDTDGVCDSDDQCPGYDDTADSDFDGVADGCDVCDGDDATGDSDGDGICNDTDPCPQDDPDDSDTDGVCDSDDQCPGYDDTADSDSDGVADGCDVCDGDDATGDSDSDGICNDTDLCPQDNPDDSDTDGVCDSDDQCPGYDDTADSDSDGVADGCDVCDGDDASDDSDGDGICNDTDPCPQDNPDDSDTDGVCDSDDQCPGYDDNVDSDSDGVADGCDQCAGFDDNVDTDDDTIADGCDTDDDGDGVADVDDNCPLIANADQADTDGNDIGDACDIPLIILNGSATVTVELDDVYTDAGAVVMYKGLDISDKLVAVSNVDTSVVGTYTVTYNAIADDGKAALPEVRTVEVTDTVVPVITLNGAATVVVEVGSAYVDGGASATDNYDGNITGSIVTANNVDTSTVGAYSVTYDVVDSSGNGAVQVVRTVNVVDTALPVITLNGAATVAVEVGSAYVDGGASATDNYDGDITGSIVTASNVDTSTIGSYTVTYNVVDANNNAASQVSRTVEVRDTTAPVITLVGSDPVIVQVHGAYSDAGATAVDNYDDSAEITELIVKDLTRVDTSVVGAYIVTYDVTDSSGNEAARVTRTVEVVDTTPPVITLLGDNPAKFEVGSAYAEYGATAADNYEISAAVLPDASSVDINTVGTYTVTYNVRDSAGNAAIEVERTVLVVPFAEELIFDRTVEEVTEEVVLCGEGTDTAGLCDGEIDEAVLGVDDFALTLESSPFSDGGLDDHVATHLRLRRMGGVFCPDAAGCEGTGYPGSMFYSSAPSEVDLTSFLIPNTGLIDGMKYFWQVGYENGSGDILWSFEYSFKVGTSEEDELPVITAGESQADFHILSMVQWPDAPGAYNVLGRFLYRGEYNKSLYRIGTYDPEAGDYVEFDEGLIFEPGRAYWFFSKEELSMLIDGVRVTPLADIDVELGYSSTGNGWNMVAPPNGGNYSWDALQIVIYDEGGERVIDTVVDGVELWDGLNGDDPDDPDHYLDHRVWEWQAAVNAAVPYLAHPAGGGFVLAVNKGYWVKAKQPGVFLRFPSEARQDLVATATPSADLLNRYMQKTGGWIKRWIMPSAVADGGDSPPLPMALESDRSSQTGAVGGGCFIATAAYGSYMAPHVMVLRELRDRFMLTNSGGRSMVEFYYTYSPPIADFIARHEGLRALVRFCLLPLVGGAYLALHFGPWVGFALFGSLVLMPFVLLAAWNRRRRACVA